MVWDCGLGCASSLLLPTMAASREAASASYSLPLHLSRPRRSLYSRSSADFPTTTRSVAQSIPLLLLWPRAPVAIPLPLLSHRIPWPCRYSPSSRYVSGFPHCVLHGRLEEPWCLGRLTSMVALRLCVASTEGRRSKADGRRSVTARWPDDGSAAARLPPSFLATIDVVPRTFLGLFPCVPVPRFGTKFLERGTQHRSSFPVTKLLTLIRVKVCYI